MKNIKNLETERLLLKPISTDDAGLILELYNSPRFIEFIGDRNIRTLEDAENYIVGKFLPQMERIGFGNYLIERKSDSMKIGAVGIFERDGLDVHDIGFSFLPEFEGQGYGFESASKLLATAFNEFGLKKISAITTKTNFSSQKLIERLGLKYIKTVRIPNDEEELLYYEIENAN
ncbi:GNAT family N-acetyltransferase [Kaistella sp. DKR-2]|uniref:GNAT family N-acetyltransferase n=1 Tax=Kaistella soli TaxID=2849654 RepID=UPI001C261215|nr:GNAT family N-acetyltransferase [Kaistella soli]MBU8883810.1 GNAT family N-acetyltransferase [Kaistella soli]